MSNLDTAKAAIEAELSAAKQGMAYYQSHVKALENALAQLAGFSSGVVSPQPAPAKRGRTPVEITKARKGRPPKAKNDDAAMQGENKLPFTGKDYWPNLITSKPQSAKDILQAAIVGLAFLPTPEQVKKLSQRMTFVLNDMVKTKKIQDSGSGRERRFFN